MSGRRCPGCRRAIAFHLYACGMCWRLLPKHLRDNITDTWAFRQAGAPDAAERHEVAKRAADDWLIWHYGRTP